MRSDHASGKGSAHAAVIVFAFEKIQTTRRAGAGFSG
jgi:hypothetical protein